MYTAILAIITTIIIILTKIIFNMIIECKGERNSATRT